MSKQAARYRSCRTTPRRLPRWPENVSASLEGSAAVGIAFAYNNIQSTVTSLIDGSIVIAVNGGITVDATFAAPTELPAGLDSQIAALAVSGAGGQDIAGAGSVSLNWIRNNVEAKISNIGDLNTDAGRRGGNEIFAAGKLAVTASDHSTSKHDHRRHQRRRHRGRWFIRGDRRVGVLHLPGWGSG